MLRVAELLPKGDPKKPVASLSVEWFYMTFHLPYPSKVR